MNFFWFYWENYLLLYFVKFLFLSHRFSWSSRQGFESLYNNSHIFVGSRFFRIIFFKTAIREIYDKSSATIVDGLFSNSNYSRIIVKKNFFCPKKMDIRLLIGFKFSLWNSMDILPYMKYLLTFLFTLCSWFYRKLKVMCHFIG